jgi:hypothetical protein
MTRHSPFVIKPSAADRAVLEKRSRSYNARHADVVRAKIVLLAADGHQNTAIAARLDVHVNVVRTWRKRFFEAGLDGLADRPRPGRPRSSPADVVAEAEAMCESPVKRDEPPSQWSPTKQAAWAVAEGLATPVTGRGAIRETDHARERPSRRPRRPRSAAPAPAGEVIPFESRYTTTATLDVLHHLASTIDRYLAEVGAEHVRTGQTRTRLQRESRR